MIQIPQYAKIKKDRLSAHVKLALLRPTSVTECVGVSVQCACMCACVTLYVQCV